jgi:hypothetical protein
VKLLNRTESGFTFLIGKRERELLLALLRQYPVLKTAHYRSRGGAKSQSARENQELLEEALAEQQRENRRNLDEMLAQAGRFQETELGFQFTVSASELEWLLQVLNDIRVGSWVQMGEPDTNRELPKLTDENVQLAWAIEMAGLFEHTLLEAANS